MTGRRRDVIEGGQDSCNNLPDVMSLLIQRLSADDSPLMNELLSMFGEAFEDADTSGGHRPRPAYLRQLLAGDSFIALAAREGSKVIGGLAASR